MPKIQNGSVITDRMCWNANKCMFYKKKNSSNTNNHDHEESELLN